MTSQTTLPTSMLDPRDPRHRPDPRVIRSPAWREGPDGKPQLFVEKKGEWKTVHPIFVASLEALRDGGGFEEAVARCVPVGGELNEKHIRIYLRRHFWSLRNEGHLEIPLPPPPDVFHGRYRRLRELGRGGIGVAHLCRDASAESEDERERSEGAARWVVVKHAWGWLSPIDKADRTMREENEALKAFDHPGIPRHIEDFERDELLHIVRDFVEGEPIASRVARQGVPAQAERRRLARAAADIVRHMHERGYLFLDPTPQNFIVRPDGALVVIDVGICRRHEGGRALSQGQAGSRGYAAYEVVARDNIGVWSDAYGLGSLLYFLAAGKPPGHTWTEEERADAVAKLDVPENERRLMLACWRRDTGARPTMREFIAMLG